MQDTCWSAGCGTGVTGWWPTSSLIDRCCDVPWVHCWNTSVRLVDLNTHNRALRLTSHNWSGLVFWKYKYFFPSKKVSPTFYTEHHVIQEMLSSSCASHKQHTYHTSKLQTSWQKENPTKYQKIQKLSETKPNNTSALHCYQLLTVVPHFASLVLMEKCLNQLHWAANKHISTLCTLVYTQRFGNLARYVRHSLTTTTATRTETNRNKICDVIHP